MFESKYFVLMKDLVVIFARIESVHYKYCMEEFFLALSSSFTDACYCFRQWSVHVCNGRGLLC